MNYCYDQTNWQLWVDVTQLTAYLFWDDVEKVEISEYFDGDRANKEAKKKIANRVIEKLKKDLKKRNGIEADQERIRLTFKDGHQIEFWNSEWGGINVFKDDKNVEKEEEY